MPTTTAEEIRLTEDGKREKNWKRWGPYLSERQWANVREDYSVGGRNCESFPYEQSLDRAYHRMGPRVRARSGPRCPRWSRD